MFIQFMLVAAFPLSKSWGTLPTCEWMVNLWCQRGVASNKLLNKRYKQNTDPPTPFCFVYCGVFFAGLEDLNLVYTTDFLLQFCGFKYYHGWIVTLEFSNTYYIIYYYGRLIILNYSYFCVHCYWFVCFWHLVAKFVLIVPLKLVSLYSKLA